MIPIDPRFMTAPAWAAQTSNVLEPYGNIPVLLTEDGWRQWAASITLLPAVSELLPARPDRYTNWQDWAAAFNEAVRLLGT